MAKNIIVPVDFSDVTDRVIAQARRLAKALEAKLWLVHVTSVKLGVGAFEAGKQYLEDAVANQVGVEQKQLLALEQALRDGGVDVTATLIVGGDPAEGIVEEAKSVDADLMVIGSHGHGALHHLLTGSTCELMLKHSPCPVLIVPSRTSAPRQ